MKSLLSVMILCSCAVNVIAYGNDLSKPEQEHSRNAVGASTAVIAYEYPKHLQQGKLSQSLQRLESVLSEVLRYFQNGDPSGCSAFSQEETYLYTELAKILKQVQQSKGTMLSTKFVQGLWSKLFLLIPQLARVTGTVDVGALLEWYSSSSGRCQCMKTVKRTVVYKYLDGELVGGYPKVEIEEVDACRKNVNVVTCTIPGMRCCYTPGSNCTFP
jgi:hypothetical protein